MSIWLKLLPLEIQEVNSLIEPTEEVREGETLAGILPDELKKLYSLWRGMKKTADLLLVELEYKKATEQEYGKIAELKTKSKALEILFWIGVSDEFHLWEHVKMVPGLRAGWQVVEFKQPETPFFRFLTPE